MTITPTFELTNRPCFECDGSGRIHAPLLNPRWLTGDVLSLARAVRNVCNHCNGKGNLRKPCEWCASTGKLPCMEPMTPIYDDGAEYHHSANCQCKGTGYAQPCPERMPILHDALMDAGCDNEALLEHCRAGLTSGHPAQMHLPGCWVLREILGGK